MVTIGFHRSPPIVYTKGSSFEGFDRVVSISNELVDNDSLTTAVRECAPNGTQSGSNVTRTTIDTREEGILAVDGIFKKFGVYIETNTNANTTEFYIYHNEVNDTTKQIDVLTTQTGEFDEETELPFSAGDRWAFGSDKNTTATQGTGVGSYVYMAYDWD